MKKKIILLGIIKSILIDGRFITWVHIDNLLDCGKGSDAFVKSLLHSTKNLTVKLLGLVNAVTKMVTGCLRTIKVAIFAFCD